MEKTFSVAQPQLDDLYDNRCSVPQHYFYSSTDENQNEKK